MKQIRLPDDWVHHLVPLTITLIAVCVVVLAPFWASSWAKLPFIGIFLEPNNVISALDGKDWPAKAAGAQSYDRLIAINGKNIRNASDIKETLTQNDYSPVQLDIETRAGDTYQVTVTPRSFNIGEIVSWFGVPYGVGLAFLGIGLWAYRMSKEQRPARAFLAFTAAFSVTTVAYFDMNTSQHFTLGWALSIPVAAGALANLSLVFPRPMNFVRNHPILRLIPWIGTILLAIPITRELLMPTAPRGYITTWFSAYTFSAIAIMLFLGSLLYRVFKDTSAMIRQQSRLIVFGAALAFWATAIPVFVTFGFGPIGAFPNGNRLPGHGSTTTVGLLLHCALPDDGC